MVGIPPHPKPNSSFPRFARWLAGIGLLIGAGLLLTLSKHAVADNPQPAASQSSPELEKQFSHPFHSFYPYTGRRGMIPLALTDKSGKTRDLSAYQGKLVLLHFWATWCPPCTKELPSLNALAREKAGESRFVILPVALDFGKTRPQIENFMKKLNMDNLSLLTVPENDKSWETLSTFNLPTTFLIGPNGEVLYKMVGDTDWSAPASIHFINQLIATQFSTPAQQK